MGQRYLDFRAAQEYLGVGETWLREKMNEGVLPFIKTGDSRSHPVRFRIEDLDTFMEHYLRPATSGPLAEVEPAPTPKRRKRVS